MAIIYSLENWKRKIGEGLGWKSSETLAWLRLLMGGGWEKEKISFQIVDLDIES